MLLNTLTDNTTIFTKILTVPTIRHYGTKYSVTALKGLTDHREGRRRRGACRDGRAPEMTTA